MTKEPKITSKKPPAYIIKAIEHLSNSKQRLALVLLDPRNAKLSTSKKCKLAEISDSMYYKAINDPKFLLLIEELSKQSMALYLPASVDAMGRMAGKVSKEGTSDRRLLFETIGWIKNGREAAVNVNLSVSQMFADIVDNSRDLPSKRGESAAEYVELEVEKR